MQIPDDLRYSSDHEWIRLEDGNRARIGITDYAQDALGDVVFVELPAPGSTVEIGAVEKIRISHGEDLRASRAMSNACRRNRKASRCDHFPRGKEWRSPDGAPIRRPKFNPIRPSAPVPLVVAGRGG